jgi:DNA helicase-2/ATP-dependent DNA helicase PcrA
VTQTPSTVPISGGSGPDPILGLEDDPEGAALVRDELRLLSTVRRALDGAAGADVSAARGRALDEERLLQLRDEVAVAKPEDLPPLFEQMHHLGALRAQRGRSLVGTVDRETPYFGHMRLEESSGGAESEGDPRRGASGLRFGKAATRRRDVLVGSRSYVDSAAGIRIVDWRHAPVSRIYYRYGEGDDYEEQLGDRLVEGVVVARRGVSIVNGELLRVSAPQGTFTRGPNGRWRRASVHRAHLETETKWAARHGDVATSRLGVGADGQTRDDKHLPAIAAMLDEHQYDLIARDSAGIVAIQGSAGSGKTTVGLHRVAYLAFREPQRFRPEKMFVVVPNEALVHYVGRVLPSLGVAGVPVTTFARFASRLVNQLFPRLPTKVSDETPPLVSRAKSHPAMLRAVSRIVARIAATADDRVRATLVKWPNADLASAAWVATNTDGATPPDLRVSMFSQWLAGKRQLPGTAPATGLSQVTRGALEQMVTDVRPQTRSVANAWDEILTSREALDEAFASEPGFAPARLDQIHAWCVRQARVRAEPERDGEEPSLDAEDPALLLRCWQELRGPLVDAEGKPIRFAHVFVDEVQDASPLELRVLLELTGKDRCITLAGDVAQRMLDDADDRGEFDWNALLDGLGVAHTTIEPLKVSYRSTAEITEFARAVLGPLSHDEVPETTRRGPPVELFTFASPGEAAAWLSEALKQLARDEPNANVALVARFPQQADLYFEGLLRAEVPNVRRVAKQDFSWEPGVDITDVRQTKGLEFDEVILLETTTASYPTSPAARHALYVGATRASHQLWCVSSQAPSELVTAAIRQPDALAENL